MSCVTSICLGLRSYVLGYKHMSCISSYVLGYSQYLLGYTSCIYVLGYCHMSWVMSYVLGNDHMSWVTIICLGLQTYVLGCYLYLLGYTSCVYVLWYVHMSWVTSYVLGDDHMSWVTCYTSWITPTEHVLPKRYACNSRGIPVTQEVYMQTKSWYVAYTSWVTCICLGLLPIPLGSHPLNMWYPRGMYVTQEVCMWHKRYACNPRGMHVTQEVCMQTKSLICRLYILGNMHMSWVTAYTSWITFSSHELPKRYACNPRGMHVTQEVYTSWVYILGIPLGLLSIPLGLLSIPLG